MRAWQNLYLANTSFALPTSASKSGSVWTHSGGSAERVPQYLNLDTGAYLSGIWTILAVEKKRNPCEPNVSVHPSHLANRERIRF